MAYVKPILKDLDGGIDRTSDPSQVGANTAVDGRNLDLHEPGAIRSCVGTVRILETAEGLQITSVTVFNGYVIYSYGSTGKYIGSGTWY